ncbi:N-acetyltransferase [Mesorhizobium sp. M1C.F.Ca.ET.193.01.1.1]|uniref:GNAT family N-acetyltransferase n=1 Tax=unclassified Mesorhizobium TaxID=325217 RepID=UPI000FD358E6|nr:MULTISPECIES: GNAT family protein [unclassified Mesorhizobium]TGS97200.1 N-acetyltransferase [bacterium M00.F.Ca.ET.177.01.1.1]TGQ52359.1 N-acetyltransferase [Mesorhizobium sp. M1C.F.Ca.ET.210.01.1.1]TGQ68989.1 N-acetyltransferase [Mesorhizobium sp. M1C.F.Ca.ET.212.01.1.1]TGR04542.1 N-acetyltransferase [Mesorhizobium sp. M1C.F.Ca.ET.204.01.1.1]TGR25309.1 N-acetyltransferase [Mesorhizobium sp. M1C.F.Ca.ET.196.01.1.1]
MALKLLDPDDVEILKRIRLEALRAAPEAFASSAADWESLPDEEWRRRLANNPVVVSFQGQEPVGLMGLMRQQASKMAHRATIVMVYLRGSERGGGHAVAMLNLLLDHARALGIRQVELAVSAENPAAMRFYLREGFHQIGCIPGGLLHEGREIDEVVMARRLT